MSEKKTDTWMPLYIGDYLADTMSFTTEQHGAYIRLLMACWREQGKPLTGTDEDLATITGLPMARWRACKAKLLAKFQVAEDGGVTHKRAAKEIQKAGRVSEARSEAGKAGAAKRWHQDGKPMANAMANSSQIDEQPQSQSQLPSQVDNPPPDRDAVGGGESAKPTKAGEVCRAIKSKGVVDVNPSNPELLALIEKGVPVETFEAAAEICAKATPRKGMGYLLGIVKRQLTEAAGIAAGVGMPVKAWDDNRATIEAKGIELGIGMWNASDVSVNRETFPQYTERVRRLIEQRTGATA